MKRLALFISIFFSFNCYSQDYVVKNNNDTINCKISSIDKVKIFYTSKEGEKYYNYLSDVKSYFSEGIKFKIEYKVTHNVIDSNSFIATTTDINYNLSKAGEELKKVNKQFYPGIIHTLSGGLLTIAGAAGGNRGTMVFVIVGGAISLVGLIECFNSISHIGKAGKFLLNISDHSKAISLNSNQNGIGLLYSF